MPDNQVVDTESVENTEVQTSDQIGTMRTMMQLGFKICNTLVISCLFIYFMLTEVDPAKAMESLTYQVK